MDNNSSNKNDQSSLPKRVDKALDWLSESRDRWKEKAKKAKLELKKKTLAVKRARENRDHFKGEVSEYEKDLGRYKEQIKENDKEIEQLKIELAKAKQQVETEKKKALAPITTKPSHHTYWSSIITTVLTLLHSASLSFTGVANTIEIFHEQEKIERAPAVETCIQWEMKFGLHKLSRPKKEAQDWVWIADHVVNKGQHKCLLVLGVRMNPLIERGDLTIAKSDLEPLGIVPMNTSNGTLIANRI